MTTQKARPAFARFDPLAISREFPPTAKTLPLDTYLTDEPGSSARVIAARRRIIMKAPTNISTCCPGAARSG